MSERVPAGSATYVEFARLYDVAAQLQTNGVSQWNGELRASSGLGHFDHLTGTIEMNRALLRDGLPGVPGSDPRLHARAMATVLQRATQAGIPLDAPGKPNAVRSDRSLALNDGIASVRTAEDFSAFVRMAGHPHLTFDPSQPTGTSAAANALINQAAGVRVDRVQLMDELGRGPVAMQFDQLADAVVRNRLYDVVRAGDQQGVRRELIGAMLHPAWERLAGQSPEAGQHVADEIGQALNAKVDEIRRRSPETAQVAPSDDPQRESTGRRRPQVESTSRLLAGLAPAGGQEESTARFLTGLAPAGGAAGRTSSLGDGSRSAAQHATSVTRSRAPGESVRR